MRRELQEKIQIIGRKLQVYRITNLYALDNLMNFAAKIFSENIIKTKNEQKTSYYNMRCHAGRSMCQRQL